MIKRIALLSLLGVLSLTAEAGILSHGTIKGDLIDLAVNPADAIAGQRLSARMLYSSAAPKEIFGVWSTYTSQAEYGQRWGEVGLNLLRWTEMGRKYDWKSATQISAKSTLIYQQDSLVDLERVQAKTISFPTVTTAGYAVVDTSSFKGGRPMTSDQLLRSGQAPIGPDNQPVKVCKLGRSSAAPYLEVSETQRQRFAKVTGLNLDSCLVGLELSAYWKARHKDFIDAYHDRTPNNAPGSSW